MLCPLEAVEVSVFVITEVDTDAPLPLRHHNRHPTNRRVVDHRDGVLSNLHFLEQRGGNKDAFWVALNSKARPLAHQ